MKDGDRDDEKKDILTMVQWRPEVLIIKNEESDHDDEEGDILTTLCIDTVRTFTRV